MYSLGSKWLMATLARWHRTEATWYCRTTRAFCKKKDNSNCQRSIQGGAPHGMAQNGEKSKQLKCQELFGDCSLSFLA